ncbi:MAG TPA: DinB family protein [Acidimicrobiales bacterium]
MSDCEECGFTYDEVDAAGAPAAIRAFGRRYRAPLTRFLPGEDGDALVRTRPAPETWSALEYAAHVRDVFANYDRWVHQVLADDGCVLTGPGPDEQAADGRYNEDDPVAVADAVAANAERLAATFESVPDDGWDRSGTRRRADFEQERSVLLHARLAVHEGNHHLLDIGRGLRAVRERSKQA